MPDIAEVLAETIPEGAVMPHGPDWKGDKTKEAKQLTHIGRRTTFIDKAGHKRKPTVKQIKLTNYLLQGYSKQQAMIKAGYSLSKAAKMGKLTTSPIMKQIMSSLSDEFQRQGLDNPFWSKKMREWAEATHKVPHVVGRDDKGRPVYDYIPEPDYEIQIKAFDRWKKVEDDTNGVQKDGKVTRKVTFEEFLQE